MRLERRVVLLLGTFVSASVSVSTLNSGGDTVVIRVVMS